ncbi:DUF5330 domain-containing protein [Aestuariivirga litoralis]|uniref:DUF5330 domain-containing protein n=1 Tax=Aestuariivirga litoralis TaxID=2650924 RepID=UPI0018C70A31|nr:DUF5330 domain-containing protein [Aestuariivirga litoralis]MBG1232470.1 DUF5330 domain-containing protein [Aestuariivirga litoralis]
MGLIRKAIVLGGILYALPFAPDAQQGGAGNVSLQSSTFAAVEAAAGTVADLKGFCERQPRACVAGQYLAYAAESKAKYLVHAAYAWSTPQPAADVASTDDEPAAQPASTKPVKNAKSGVPALRTATINDTKPASIEDLLKGTQE